MISRSAALLGRGSLREIVSICALAVIAALFTGVNLFGFPQFESDEGTYMGSAWAMYHHGQLSYYTYNYDHPPFGWFLIGGWASLIGGFLTFGTAVATGRALMLVVAIISTVLVYAIVRTATAQRTAAIFSATLFAVSPLAIDLHRQVWLDNLATLWLLLSFYLLLTAKGSMTRVLVSAIAFGLSFWTKEVMAAFLPGMIVFAIVRMHPAHRLFASVIWAATATSVMSLFVLLAVLKDELLPPGVLWSSQAAHVSLFDTYQWQLSRRGGSIFDPNSDFAMNIRQWASADPLLVLGGCAAALIGLLLFRRDHVFGAVSLLALSFVVFLGRGGQVLFYYVIPLVSLFVLTLGLLLGRVANVGVMPRVGRGAIAGLFLVASVVISITSADAKSTTFTANRTDAQRDAVAWIINALPRDSVILMDSYAWVDLREISLTRGEPFLNSHYFWPGVSDPAVRFGLLNDDWRNIDYLAFSPSMEADVARLVLPLVPDALKNADMVASFQSQDWTVRIMRVRKFKELQAHEDPVLSHAWESYKARFIDDGRVVDPKRDRATTSEAQAYALTRAVYMGDRQTFDRVWAWTQAHLQLRGDALFSWLWGARAAAPQAATTEEPSAIAISQLRPIAVKWAQRYLARTPTETEIAWLARNGVPAMDEHVSAFYEQTRDGTVWLTDPATYRALRDRIAAMWRTIGSDRPLPPALVAQAIADGWNDDQVRRALESYATGAVVTWPRAPMTILDWNSATDADEDIALALLFAAKQWGEDAYRDDALRVIKSIWEEETAVAGGRRVLVAGNWARGDWSAELDQPVVNPSYFAPNVYRVFAEVDPAHPWRDLVDSSYDVLARVRTTPELGGAAGLVPNWLQLDATTGRLLPADVLGPAAHQFSHDASRIYWRLALDWLWFKDDRARAAIHGLSFVPRQLKDGGILLAAYNLDGTPADRFEALSMYGATLAGLLFESDRTLAQRVFAERILRVYSADASGAHWGDDKDDSYNQSWAWFATALMDGAVTNIWAGQPPIRLAEVLP